MFIIKINVNPSYIHYQVWDGITYPLSNFNVAAVEVWEWLSNYITYFKLINFKLIGFIKSLS